MRPQKPPPKVIAGWTMRRGPLSIAPSLSACVPRIACLSSTAASVLSPPCTCRVHPVGIAPTAVSSKLSQSRYFPLPQAALVPPAPPLAPAAPPFPAPPPPPPPAPAPPLAPALPCAPALPGTPAPPLAPP